MKCIFIIQYNDMKPEDVGRFIQRIPSGKNFQLIDSLQGGVVWVVETNSASESDFYMGLISELVAEHLNKFYLSGDKWMGNNNGTEVEFGNLDSLQSITSRDDSVWKDKIFAKWSRIPLNELIGCFVPIGKPIRGNDNNPYAILPLGLLSSDENFTLNDEGQLTNIVDLKVNRKLLAPSDLKSIQSFFSIFTDKEPKRSIGLAGGEGGHSGI